MVSYEETYNEIKTFSSLDLIQRFSTTVKGEFSGIGATVTSSTEARAHSEVATNQFNSKKQEVRLDTSAHIRVSRPSVSP